MKNIVAIILALCIPAEVLADTIEIPTEIDHVTIYKNGAEVSETADVKLSKGTYRLRIPNLPSSLQNETLRISSSINLDISGVTIKRKRISKAMDSEVRELEDRVQSIKAAIKAMDTRDKALEIKIALAKEKNNNSLKAYSGMTEKDYQRLRNHVDQTIGSYVDEKMEIFLDKKQAEEDLKIAQDDLLRRRGTTPDPFRFSVFIDVVVRKDGQFPINLAYFTPKPQWKPSYNVWATDQLGDKVNFSLQAKITQTTGKSWSDVKIKLSSAVHKKQSSLSLPPDTPVSYDYPDGVTNKKGMRTEAMMVKAPVAKTDKLSVEWEIPERQDIPSSTEGKKISFAWNTLPAKHRYISKPYIDEKVYLESQITNDLPFALPAGPAILRYGENIIGKHNIKTTQPGQVFSVGFGPSEKILIDREKVEDKANGPSKIAGMKFGRSNRVIDYKTTIQNTTESEVSLVVYDRIPHGKGADITVIPTGELTRHWDEVDLGIYQTDKKVSPKKEVEYLTGYEMTWPNDKSEPKRQ